MQIFPDTWRYFSMNCSCPDSAVPCKHLAAVIYMLSREIDNNPFLVFTIHGIDFEKELKAIQEGKNKALKLALDKIEKDFGKEAFPNLLASYSTEYVNNPDRTTNLRLAAKKINGTVVLPGEIFSYNKVVGKRTTAAGYKNAAIYQDGGVTDGLGGGICQISTTLYNAAIEAGMLIEERRNHMFVPSYADAGKDATVVWGSTDFKFENRRAYPIKIEATVNNGIAEFKIHGMQEEVEYEVRILPVKTKSIPYTTFFNITFSTQSINPFIVNIEFSIAFLSFSAHVAI